MTIVGAGKDLRARIVAAEDIRRTSACMCLQRVERYMTVAMPHGGILQSDPQLVCAQQACWDVPTQG